MSVDQEGKIKIVPESSVLGSNFRYAIVIVNESTAPITQIGIKLEYPQFLTLNRLKPKLNYKLNEKDRLISLTVQQLEGQSKVQINFYFNPIKFGKGQLKNSLLYINNQDFVRSLETQLFDINLAERTFIPTDIPSSEIANITKAAKFKGIKSYGKPDNLQVINAFTSMTHLIQTSNFHQVLKKEEGENNTAWFYGTDQLTNDGVLIITQTLNNKMEIISMTTSDDPNINISILTKLAYDLRKRLFNTGTISSIDALDELTCDYCGGIFDHYPIKGEEIICKFCNKKQTFD